LAKISVSDLSLYLPLLGANTQSIKRYLKDVAIGGVFARRSTGATEPILVALSNVNLSLAPGDRLGLVGSNGSGKTTLLRCLAGVYKPDRGMVEVEGRVASLLDLSLGIDPSATGIENIRLRGLVAGLAPGEIKRREVEIGEFSGLGPFLAMPMRSYSSGMQARLAFATATSVEADILLMDEWIAVGDAEFRVQAHQRLTSMVEKSKIMVLATHDRTLLGSLCNKVMRMDHGSASEILPIDQMNELLARPANRNSI
jgi:lipopolysaccharide transport system ATP-binding protein